MGMRSTEVGQRGRSEGSQLASVAFEVRASECFGQSCFVLWETRRQAVQRRASLAMVLLVDAGVG